MILAAAFVLAAAGAPPEAPPLTREQCEIAYPANWGRPGKDVVWVPTLDAVVLAMLSMAEVTPRDLVYDLGAGDGKIAIAAARSFDARAVGIEYEPALARRAECLVRAEGLADKVRIVQGDIFKEDFGAASVVTLYLLPDLNLCVRHRLLAMKPGTRVVSHQFSMADWPPEKSVQAAGREVHLWVVPARVGGVWDFRDNRGSTFAIDLRQSFSALTGEIERDGVPKAALLSATLRGVELRFTFDADGKTVTFTGTVRGDEIKGVLSKGSAARTAAGRPRGALRAASWAEMLPDCSRFYDR